MLCKDITWTLKKKNHGQYSLALDAFAQIKRILYWGYPILTKRGLFSHLHISFMMIEGMQRSFNMFHMTINI